MVNPSINLKVFLVSNPFGTSIRIQRDDLSEQTRGGEGLAWNVRGIQVFVKEFSTTENPPRYITIVSDGDNRPSQLDTTGLTSDERAELSNTQTVYRRLADTYSRRVVALPDFDWGVADGIRAGLRILRTHEGRAVHPYRRFRFRMPLTTKPVTQRVKVGQWIEHAVTIRNVQYRVIARVEHITLEEDHRGKVTMLVECVIDPSTEARLPQQHFRVDDTLVDSTIGVG